MTETEQSVDQMDVKLCTETIQKYPEILIGVKTAHTGPQARGTANTLLGCVDRAIAVQAHKDSGDVRFLASTGPQLFRSDPEKGASRRHPHPCLAQQFPIILNDGTINPI